MATSTEVPTYDPDMDESDAEAAAALEGTPDADVGEAVGRSIEDIANGGEPVEDEEGQTLLDFGDHLNLSIKGKKPTVSKVKIKAISREIKGQLGDRGDDERVFVIVEARLDEVATKSFRDSDSGRVVRKERRHILEPVGVVRLPEEVATELMEDYADGTPGEG